jgi:hypothetical protein
MPTSEARPKARIAGAVQRRPLGSASNPRLQSGRSAAALEEQDRQSTEDVPASGKTQVCRVLVAADLDLWAVVSAVDRGHVGLIVSLAGGGFERVEPLELVGGELNVRGGGVLLNPCDAAGARDGSDVVTTAEEPGQRSLGGSRADLGSDRGDLVDEGEVALEVVAGEAGVRLAPVVVAEIVDGADLPGEQAMPSHRLLGRKR